MRAMPAPLSEGDLGSVDDRSVVPPSGDPGPGLLRRAASWLVGADVVSHPSGTPGHRREAVLAGRLETLLSIAERLTRTLDRQEIFRTIVDEASRALAVDAATIRLVNGDALELVASAGMTEDDVAQLPAFRRDEGWFAEIARSGRPMAIEDVRAAPTAAFDRYTGAIAIGADLIVPLFQRDRIIGALSCASAQPRSWSPDDLEFVSALAAHASIALHNAELAERTEARARRLAVLEAASSRINRARTIEAVGRAIVEETRRVIDYHNARVYVLEQPRALVPIAFEGRVGEYEKVDMELLRTTLGHGFTGWVGEHGVPLLIDDANSDPRGTTIPGTDDVDESMLVVPMRYDDLVVGVITLSKLGLRQFTEDDLQMLAILADQAATALESARLLVRSQGFARELGRIVDMSSALSGSLDPREVANLIADHLAAALGVDDCFVSYWDRMASRIETLGCWPAARFAEIEPSFDVTGFPETLRVLSDQAMVVIHADDPAADAAETGLMRTMGNQTLAMLPLVVKGESTGLVELLSKKRIAIDAQQLALARTMANEAAMALENARLYDAARNLADRDPLTGFYNHRYLQERLGEEVVRAQRSRRPLSVLMVDLDDFKLVNDTFGHLFGDRLLVWIADRIRSTLRSADVPARYGGDEFAIILPEAEVASARSAAERILRTFREQPFESGTRGPVPVALSIGIATHPQDGRTATDLIAAADLALYAVKDAGGHDARAADDQAERSPEVASGAA